MGTLDFERFWQHAKRRQRDMETHTANYPLIRDGLYFDIARLSPAHYKLVRGFADNLKEQNK